MTSVKLAGSFTVFLVHALGAQAEYLSGFEKSSKQSKFGAVETVRFSTEPLELEPGLLAHHLPAAMRQFRFREPVWIVGYKTSVVGTDGSALAENYLCHTFLGDQRVMQREDQELRGIYSDAFTPDVQLPDGFGIHFAGDENLHWMPMFNNRADTSVRVRMQVELSVIREARRTGAIQPLYGILRSVQVPHLYFVKNGRDTRHSDFRLPATGRIHFMGTHLHPYGKSVELVSLAKNRVVWSGNRRQGADGEMQVYSSDEGYLTEAGESFRLTAVYDNPTEASIDAMAGLFILYTRN